MEKRALLAALLSGVVLVLWYAVVAPPQRGKASGAGSGPSAAAAPAGSPTAAAAPAEAPIGGTPIATPRAVAAIRATAVEDLPLAGRGWHAVVSTQGGVVRSLVLADYKDDKGQPLELVGHQPLLSVGGAGPWNDEAYTVEREGEAVRLRWSDGRGNWVDKRLVAGSGRYTLAIEVRAGGEPARLGVLIGAGVGQAEKSSARGSFGIAGAVVRLGGKLDRIKPEKLEQARTVTGAVGFAGVEDQYFLVVMLPEGELSEVRVEGMKAAMGPVATVAVVGVGGEVRGTLYAGPKDHGILVGYGRGLDETLSFGIFGVLSVGFLAALRWIHSWTANWGLAIIVLTAGIRVLLFPLTHKSTVAMRRMQALQPRMKAIQERYKERAKRDSQVRTRMNQELMQVYKQEGVNPLGGCLPTLVQLPILWALYTLFAYAIELRHAPLGLWIHDLSVKDPTYITPILMTASMVVQQRLTPQVGDPTQRRMFILMPFIFGLMFINFPAGLVLYWLVNNLLTIGQQMLTERLLRDSAKKPQLGS